MTEKQFGRRNFLATTGAMSSLLLAGCSSSNTTQAETPTSSTSDQTTQTPTTQPTTQQYTPTGACPMFNYDAQNRGSTNQGNAPTGSVSKNWKKEGVSGYASPVVYENTVYVAADRETRAIDLESGDVKWTVPVGESTPVVTPNALFSGSRGVLAAYALDGSELWQTEWRTDGGARPKLFGLTLADDTLYFNTRAGVTRAVNASNGELVWKYPSDGSLDEHAASPVAVSSEYIVVSTRSEVFAVSRAEGTREWGVQKGETVQQSSASVESTTNSAPVIDENTVYVGGPDGVIRALALSDGSERWTVTANGQVNSTPAVVDGTLYVGSRDSNLYAIDTESGDIQWTTEASWIIDSHPTVANDLVVVMDSGSRIFGIATEGGEKQWKYQFDDTWAYSSPVIANGNILFTTSHGMFYALK